MKKPKVLVLTGYGINCDYETQTAFAQAGGDAKRVHINDIIDGKVSLDDYQIIAFPGGFSFGDDIGAGKVLAVKFEFRLGGALRKFVSEGNLVIGICNGFQAITKLGILPAVGKAGTQEATLTFNDSGRFEDRWVYLKVNEKSPCIFTKNLDRMYLPVRHGEGKFIAANDKIQSLIMNNQQVALQYCDEQGNPTQEYPLNPNGSPMAIAGVCDPTGRIFGLMPHPEAYLFKTNHPRWTRETLPEEGIGQKIFHNAVEFACRNLM
jgi:phosphoribosylformylglycinamidine synthase subunit PurQ / glutaminase